MHRSYTYRLYPTRRQRRTLDWQVDSCRELYNKLLQDRRRTFKVEGHNPSKYEQCKSVAAIKHAEPDLGLDLIHSQVLQDVAFRVESAYQNFFSRVKEGESPGLPRFKGDTRYDSITFPQAPSGCHLNEDGTLFVSKVGNIKVNLHRRLAGEVIRATVKRTATGKWYVVLLCKDVPKELAKFSPNEVFVDIERVERELRSSGEVKRLRRKLQKSDTRETRKALARAYERVQAKKADRLNQTAKAIAGDFGTIFIEKSMSGRDLVEKLYAKAEEAGRRVIKVDSLADTRYMTLGQHGQVPVISKLVSKSLPF